MIRRGIAITRKVASPSMPPPQRRLAPTPAPPQTPPWRPRRVVGLPKVLILADVPNWAWAKKANALKRCLAGRIDVDIVCSTNREATMVIREQKHDLYHTFEVSQVGTIPIGWPMTTGITAHVAHAWGPIAMKAWADRAVGFHANSIMLQKEMEAMLNRPIHYVPNGVDETFYQRTRRRPSDRLVVGYVARPNPRKGPEIVERACKLAGVELRPIVRKWKDKNVLSAEQMRDYYQDIHVLAVSSDMDGTPNPALEAAACECAIVSNPIGNMPQFIEHGVNGLMTERTVDSLAAALSDLAARSIGEVERMGIAARQTILRDWTWAKRADAYATMWEQCVQKVAVK